LSMLLPSNHFQQLTVWLSACIVYALSGFSLQHQLQD